MWSDTRSIASNALYEYFLLPSPEGYQGRSPCLVSGRHVSASVGGDGVTRNGEVSVDYLLKTEPSVYSWEDLLRDKTTVWDGVTNPVAVKHLVELGVRTPA